MHRGFVKLYRKSISNPLFSKPLVWHFWEYCLIRANHKGAEIDFNGKPLKLPRGSFVMSLRNSVKETGLTIRNIRTAIKILVNHEMIEKSTQETTQQATVITVCNYTVFQDFKNDSDTVHDTQATQTRHTGDTDPTLDKNVKNNKELNKKVKKRVFVENSDEYRLAKLLSDLMIKNNPDNQVSVRAKNNKYQSWSEEVRKMNKLDKRSFEEIEYLINWSQRDSFWQSNILSTAKLRTQFDALVLKIKEQKDKKQSIQQQPKQSTYERMKADIEANNNQPFTQIP